MPQEYADFNIGRRHFLQLTAGGVAALLLDPAVTTASSPYLVGVGRSTDPYVAAQRAIAASTQWPAAKILGKTVVIKPNLVAPQLAQTGITTDPQVVRALVDAALAAGAVKVSIIEGGLHGAPFSICGYDFFNTYDARVSLIDLTTQPSTFQPVPHGMVYRKIALPTFLFQPDVVYISAAKLKTHVDAMATLSMKNSVGLPPITPYHTTAPFRARFAMHQRSIQQTIIDLNLTRPIDFAVVDGVWGLEGNGPLQGTPVSMNMVVAGLNPVAVDRICVDAMMLPQAKVQYLDYASQRGLGPATIGEIQVLGDGYTPFPFVQPVTPPVVVYPQAQPRTFTPSSGQVTQLTYSVDSPCETHIEIERASDTSPSVTVIRLLQDWTSVSAGSHTVQWDGYNNQGTVVMPGAYSVNVHARATSGPMLGLAYATGFVIVSA